MQPRVVPVVDSVERALVVAGLAEVVDIPNVVSAELPPPLLLPLPDPDMVWSVYLTHQ